MIAENDAALLAGSPGDTGTAGPDDLVVQQMPKDRLPECAELYQDIFGLEDKHAVPAWEMHLGAICGGLSIGALVGGRVVGFSYAFPAFDGSRAYLFSSGLAVHPAFQSRGIGRALKLHQRRLARRAGYSFIRWTAEPLASHAMYLHLTRLGCELVSYVDELYEPFNHLRFRLGGVVDAVVVDWPLADDEIPQAGTRTPASIEDHVITHSSLIEGDLRAFHGWNEAWPTIAAGTDGALAVEIPWDVDALQVRDPDRVVDWRLGVRAAMHSLLDHGYRGTEIVADRAGHRSFAVFEKKSSTAS